MYLRISLLLTFLLLTACASLPNPYGGSEPREPDPVYLPETRTPEPPVSSPEPRATRNPALIALAGRAQSAFEQGRLEQAAATLERAINIDADDAGAWLMLGWVRLGQGEHRQASALAQRAQGLDPNASQSCLAGVLLQAAETSRGGWPQTLHTYRESRQRCTPQAI